MLSAESPTDENLERRETEREKKKGKKKEKRKKKKVFLFISRLFIAIFFIEFMVARIVER